MGMRALVWRSPLCLLQRISRASLKSTLYFWLILYRAFDYAPKTRPPSIEPPQILTNLRHCLTSPTAYQLAFAPNARGRNINKLANSENELLQVIEPEFLERFGGSLVKTNGVVRRDRKRRGEVTGAH